VAKNSLTETTISKDHRLGEASTEMGREIILALTKRRWEDTKLASIPSIVRRGHTLITLDLAPEIRLQTPPEKNIDEG
jgi:hypothetical protein